MSSMVYASNVKLLIKATQANSITKKVTCKAIIEIVDIKNLPY